MRLFCRQLKGQTDKKNDVNLLLFSQRVITQASPQVSSTFFFPSIFTEARGEIQNFVNNFLENPSQEGNAQQSEDEQEELNVDIVKEEQIMQT